MELQDDIRKITVALLIGVVLINLPLIARSLTIPGVFDGYEGSVIFERMYVPDDQNTRIWYGVGLTEYLPYTPYSTGNTIFPVVCRISRKGWIDGWVLYDNLNPTNYNQWHIYVKWSDRDMNIYDREYIKPHGWKLSVEDVNDNPYSISLQGALTYSGIQVGFTVNFQPADYKDTNVPLQGELTDDGWLDLGWGKTNRQDTFAWEDEYVTTAVALISWNNAYMSTHYGDNLYIKIESVVRYQKFLLPLFIPAGEYILVWPATLGDNSYDSDGTTTVIPGYISLPG